MPLSPNAAHPRESGWITRVRQIVQEWLQTCDLTYPAHIDHDDEFYNICYTVALSKGYAVHETGSIAPYLPVGVNMAATAFAHLPDMSTRVWIALYTAFLTASDDLFLDDVSPVKVFFRRMLLGKPQEDPALDGMAAVLTETAQHFDAIQDAIILTSSFNLITALPVENVMNGVSLRPCAEPYAQWSSVLSGANEAYAMFTFPREVPFKAYAHAIPDMMTFIRNTNDILSFYKEELAGETVNHVSLVAQCRDISHVDALKVVADESAAAYLRVVETLQENPAARTAWLSFATGYIGFHVASKRYRLDELRVTDA
ncbi:terpenoid synthase [Auricularia subglabra TFB-10046 SS5]|nr:terpenoid synthase [Auricularia subglabra TFB-10046 SS5]